MHGCRRRTRAARGGEPASALSAYEYLGAPYNRLVRVDANGDLAPDLAESWEPDAQARPWTFRFREGVTFHDGRRLTAADAAYTLRHILDKATASPQAAVLAPLIQDRCVMPGQSWRSVRRGHRCTPACRSRVRGARTQ
ncbi:ABC transporter substrate-binding protein [Streptomyces sp. NPDC056704]|uniref:ABC transporter substrate-binding protein n=1 Tax=Streptomyces sp. NPDC056704 TaxID=3345917 RepID=UPI00367FC23F